MQCHGYAWFYYHIETSRDTAYMNSDLRDLDETQKSDRHHITFEAQVNLDDFISFL